MVALLGLFLLLALASPAYADARGAAGRAFVLLADSDGVGGSGLDVAADGAVWSLAGDGSVWRLRPGALRMERVRTDRRAAELAVLEGGDLLLASRDEPRIWRRARNGASRLVAGSSGPPVGPSVDDGPATGSLICSVGAIAALPDDAFAFVDREGKAVRRVAADGTISTVYAVAPAERAYGCPGYSESDEYVIDLAARRDGSLLVLLASAEAGKPNSIVRVAPGGAQTVLLRRRQLASIAAGADGSVLMLGERGAISRLARGAEHPDVILGGSAARPRTDPFGPDGVPGSRFSGNFGRLAPAPDGGIVASGYQPALVYVAPAAPARLAAALDPRSGRATPGRYAVTYWATRRARARVVVSRGGRSVASVQARARTGRNTIAVNHPFRFGTYRVRLTVRARGQLDRSTVRVYLGGALPVENARALVVPETVEEDAGCSNCDPEVIPVRFELCRRIDPRRVDCRYGYESSSGEHVCEIRSAQLRATGAIVVRRYRCPDGPGIPARPPRGAPLWSLPLGAGPVIASSAARRGSSGSRHSKLAVERRYASIRRRPRL